MLKKMIWIFLALCIVLLSILFALFYRSDIPIDVLKETYFTTYSYERNVTILSLDDQNLDIQLHYQRYGDESDEVIVLLHGMFASSHTFLPWAQMLIAQGYQVISVDLPYHGLSSGFDDQVTSIRRSAYAVHALLKSLNIDTFFIGGNSMGGAVSWYLTSEFHDVDMHILGLILIDAVYPSLGENHRSFGILSSDLFAGMISKMTPKFLLRRILTGAYGSQSTLDEAVLQRYYDLILKEGFRYQLITQSFEDLSDDLSGDHRLLHIASLNIPTLVLWGDEDSWISKDYAYMFFDILNVSEDHFVIYQGVGHVPMEENPSLTFTDLLKFLNSI